MQTGLFKTVWGICQYVLLTVAEIVKENSYTLAK